MDERTNDLDRILARDRGRVIALARRLQRARDPEVRARLQEERAQIIAASHAAWQARLAARPEVTYPPELPVSQKADAIAAAKRPVIYAGTGVHWARAWPQLKALAELLAAPVTTSLGGKSSFPEDHPLALGVRRGDAGRRRGGAFQGLALLAS